MERRVAHHDLDLGNTKPSPGRNMGEPFTLRDRMLPWPEKRPHAAQSVNNVARCGRAVFRRRWQSMLVAAQPDGHQRAPRGCSTDPEEGRKERPCHHVINPPSNLKDDNIVTIDSNSNSIQTHSLKLTQLYMPDIIPRISPNTNTPRPTVEAYVHKSWHMEDDVKQGPSSRDAEEEFLANYRPSTKSQHSTRSHGHEMATMQIHKVHWICV